MRLARPRSAAGILAVGAIALIAGCGGGDDTLTADEYRQQADAICADANRATDALDEPTAPEEILPYLEAGLSVQESELDRFRDLDPPEELRSGHDRAVDLLQRRQDRIREVAEEIRGGADPEEVVETASAEIDQLRAEGRAAAGELGLQVCRTEEEEPGTETGPGQVATPQRFTNDTIEAANALRTFGQLLQGVESVEDLRDSLGEARESLDRFDAAIAELDGYTLSESNLESRRAGLAATGPNVSDVLRRFLDAAADGDAEAVERLVGEVQQAISEFQQAAAGAESP